MFTGIIEELGTVAAVEQHIDAIRLSVRGAVVLEGTRVGDSIAVNGCCLTVTSTDSVGIWTADVMKESLDRTVLGGLRPGDPVNLERAATIASRLGGHLVQGHVDGVGTVVKRSPSERWEVIEIGLPPSLTRYVVEKGSIAVDGVSLTVMSTHLRSGTGLASSPDGDHSFAVSLIPETLSRTTLGTRAPGERVNLEVDVLAKYVERLLAVPGAAFAGGAAAGAGQRAPAKPVTEVTW
jgi:riboflavin synthase